MEVYTLKLYIRLLYLTNVEVLLIIGANIGDGISIPSETLLATIFQYFHNDSSDEEGYWDDGVDDSVLDIL